MTPTVSLISCTQDAETVLIFSKNTRLNLSPALFEQIKHWDDEKVAAELAYMATTIRSSWEFVDLTFLVEGVTRACAQQMTRTRTASYAMQSQRVTNAGQMAVANPYDPASDNHMLFETAVTSIRGTYDALLAGGGKLEDARGILPMNTTCNLLVKYNLRSFADVLAARKSFRAQGEYADIVLQMEKLVLEEWPWATEFFKPQDQMVIGLLSEVVKELGVKTGHGPGWQIAKAIDMLRK
jgi:flavin-dependent thymidylate synthase